MNDSLITRVQQLPAANAIEAAKIVASSIADEPSMTGKEFEKEFGDPLSHVSEMEEFAKILLINAGQNPDYTELVEGAIANSGKKQFIFGGAEYIAFGIIAIAALKVILNPVSEEEFEYVKKDGTKVKVKKKHNNDTGFLSKIFGKFF